MSVTIAIPFYNAEKYLAQAIQSVFAQTYQDWELILIDDGSTDKSLEIANSVQDKRVKVYFDGKNKKLASRLNEITNLARYEYIARMDADDLMSPTRIERQLKILEENPHIDLVSTGVYSVSNELILKGIRGVSSENISFKDLLYKKKGIVHAAILGRKSWFVRNRYNTQLSIAQDYDLWLRTSLINDLRIILLKEPLYIYREEDNVITEKILKAYKNERKMYMKYAKNSSYIPIFKSLLKSIIVYSLDKIGQTDFLLTNRNTNSLSSEIVQKYKEELNIILNTKVKGLI